MGTLLGLFGMATPLVLLALICGIYIYWPKLNPPTEEEILQNVRRYRKKRPDATPKELRQPLIDRFTPPLDQESPMGSGCLLGAGGALGVQFALWLKRLRYEQGRQAVEAKVDQALATLRAKRRGSPHSAKNPENDL